MKIRRVVCSKIGVDISQTIIGKNNRVNSFLYRRAKSNTHHLLLIGCSVKKGYHKIDTMIVLSHSHLRSEFHGESNT